MTLGEGGIRTPYEKISAWLASVPHEQLQQRRMEAELFYRRGGITFAVYGDAQGEERMIPFDFIQGIISSKEGKVLAKAPEQRVKAINLFLADIYGPQKILKAGIVPEDLIWQN